MRGRVGFLAVAAFCAASLASARSSPTASDLEGAWLGTLTHAGEAQDVALELEPHGDGTVTIRLSIPVTHLAHAILGRAPLEIDGPDVRFGPFRFTYAAQAGGGATLTGTVPAGLVPVYEMTVTLRHVARLELPARETLTAPAAEPVWTFDAGAPLWPGPSFADGLVFAGADDGRVHAIEAASGRERWAFRAGAQIRSRATPADGDVYVQADDGVLYKLAASSGEERWRAKVVGTAITRVPLTQPGSRFDCFASDVTVGAGRLYLGTHDGRVLALDPASGARLWEFRTGDSVLAAPALDSGRLYVGSYDGNVYAVDAASGALLWKTNMNGAVVSTPTISGDRLIVGSRSYDLTALDPRSGARVWNRYIWFSWVESPAAVRDGVAFVGSSDAAAVFALDARTGSPQWQQDVYGWSWGQPAVTQQHVVVGTAAASGYVSGHRAGILALDRTTGRPVWHYDVVPAESGTAGFPGSPALGADLVFLAGLDGRVYAFRP